MGKGKRAVRVARFLELFLAIFFKTLTCMKLPHFWFWQQLKQIAINLQFAVFIQRHVSQASCNMLRQHCRVRTRWHNRNTVTTLLRKFTFSRVALCWHCHRQKTISNLVLVSLCRYYRGKVNVLFHLITLQYPSFPLSKQISLRRTRLIHLKLYLRMNDTQNCPSLYLNVKKNNKTNTDSHFTWSKKRFIFEKILTLCQRILISGISKYYRKKNAKNRWGKKAKILSG